MKKGHNTNHPSKGSQIKVEPIREKKDIGLIKKLLSDKPLDLALFTVGINTNLRASDLLQITYAQVKDIAPGDSIEIKEKKTGKYKQITLNKACVDAIEILIDSKVYKDTDMLFKGQRGSVTVPGLSTRVKGWCKAINLKGNYGSHTLRKTWGYHQRKTFGVSIPILMVCFNHSSQRQTLDYLCIQPEEVKDVYMNEL